MRMSEISPGEQYYIVNNHGRQGSTITSRRVRVLEVGVAKDKYSTTLNRVRVIVLRTIKNDEGEITGYEDATRYDDSPDERLLLAKELISLAEGDAHHERQRLEELERQRLRKQRDIVEEVAEGMVAARLGIPRDSVSISMSTDSDGQAAPYRCSIDNKGIAAVIAHDDDADMIEYALAEVSKEKLAEMSYREIALAIVSSLRGDISEEDDEAEDA